MNDLKYCQGCGVQIQSDNPKGLGYTPPSALQKEQIICQRCFKIKHYNEITPIQVNENDFLQILNSIGKSDSLVVQIVDLFDIDGTLISGLSRFIGKNPFIMVANKIDLFPKSIKHNRVKHWLSRYVREHDLNPEQIFLISADKDYGIEEVASYIKQKSKGKDVYVVGATNVGKSTFVNRLIKLLAVDNSIELTTSKYPGTTLNIVAIPLSAKQSIIDTPGVVNRQRYSELVLPETLNAIIPKKTIKPKVFQLSGEQSLFFGGLARIDQINRTNNSFVCYLSNELMIHRTKLGKADEIYEKHLGELLNPPSIEEVEKFPKMSKHSFKIPADKKYDIVISGLGWVSIIGEATYVDVYAPKGIGVHLREALI